MNENNDRIKNLYHTLMKNTGKIISTKHLAKEAGYKDSSLRTYISKNLLTPYVSTKDKETCIVSNNLQGFTLADLRRALAQRRFAYSYQHLGYTELVSNLIERSRTNAGLALELINRPELSNRLDSFVLLFVTAWEQLLKAQLEIQTKGSIFTGGQTSTGRTLTICFSECINKIFPQAKSPIRKNIEALKDLRDSAAHLLVPDLAGIVTRYFQAGILNYIEFFQKLAEEPPFRFDGTGLLTLGVAYSSPSIEVLRIRYGEYADEIKSLIDELERSINENNSDKFAVSIEYKLVLEKKPGTEAIHLANNPEGLPAVIIHVPKDPSITHPHMTKDCAKILSEKTSSPWTIYSVTLVANFFDIKKANNQYHYSHKMGKSEHHCYSDAFIDYVAERFRQDPDLLNKAESKKRTKRK